MSTVGIVLISLLAGILIALQIAACVYVIWMQSQLKRSIVEATISYHEAANSISLLKTSIEGILQSHATVMAAEVSKINGVALAQASQAGIAAARRIEIAASAIGELVTSLLSEEELAIRRIQKSDLAPEAFAPSDGTPNVTQSRVARQDRDGLDAESEGIGV